MVKRTGKGPTVFVRKYGRKAYYSRETVDRIVREVPNEATMRHELPRDIAAKYLEQDFTQGRGKNDRETMKRNFRKMPTEAIRDALGQPSPEGEE